jgi:DNA-binding transcriptional LysR family regulator
MELKYLLTFKTILEEGSFQNAAKKLNYAQSTITFQIQQLEQELSIRLFEQIGRKMVLTQAGKEILPYIDSILLSVEQLSNHGKKYEDITGTLNIAITEALLIYKMQPVLKAFRQQAPNIKLSMTSMSCYKIREKILNGSMDIGIHFDVGGYNSTIITETLSDYDLTLVASPDLNETEHDFITPNQFKGISQISKGIGSQYFDIFMKYLQQKKIVLENNLLLSSIEAIKISVMNNLGVAYLPKFTVNNELKSGALVEIQTDIKNNHVTAICAYHKNRWITPAMRLFLSLSKEALSK